MVATVPPIMIDPLDYLLYGLVKLVAYTAWCAVGIYLTQPTPRTGGGALWRRATKLGVARWLLGVAFGAIVFFALATTREQVSRQYVLVYAPVRIVEWAIIGVLLRSPRMGLASRIWHGWVVGGVLVSFASDYAWPEMIEHGRFCVGRCLC